MDNFQKPPPIQIGPSEPIVIRPGPPPVTIEPSNLSFDRFRPIYIIEEEGLTEGEQTAAVQGVMECLRQAGVSGRIQTSGLGVWREIGYLERGTLVAYKSIDWLIATSPDIRGDQMVNASRIIGQGMQLMYQQHKAYYFLLVLRRNMGVPRLFPVMGNTNEDVGSVVSNYWLRRGRIRLTEAEINNCLKTIVLHELGHLFGLWSRQSGPPSNVGPHCPWENRCIMRAMPGLAEDTLAATRDWQRFGRPFCPGCLANLRRYFNGQ